MAIYIIWEDAGGHIFVDVPAPDGRMADESRADWIERVAKRTEAAYLAAGRTRLPDHEGPFPSRTYRDCWRKNGSGLEVDMPLARIQRMGEIRQERDSLLIESDKDKARLDDIGKAAEITAMANYRQALRDLPASVDLEPIATAEELEAFKPTMPVKP